MPDYVLPTDHNTVIGLHPKYFADMAVTAALWLVSESTNAIANKTAFDPDPINRFRLADRLPEALVLRDLTEDQRNDMFVEGFRNLGNPGGMENAFEILLSHNKESLWEAFRIRWDRIANR